MLRRLRTKLFLPLLVVGAGCAGYAALATETEHLGMQVLPAPGKVVVDGRLDDWDYVLEAAVPVASLGLTLTDGLSLRGDFGVTHGDSPAKDTLLRTHWNNQSTGLVNDDVLELKVEPANWGEIAFP